MARTRFSPYKSTVLLSGKGRPGWSITFNHPRYLHDKHDNRSLKVRRGLGTRDEELAKKMGEEMNVLLAESGWWKDSMRSAALAKFEKSVVVAFYDGYEGRRPNMLANDKDGKTKRDEEIGIGIAMARDSVQVQIAQLATDRALLMGSLTSWAMSRLGLNDEDIVEASRLAFKLSGGVIDKFVSKEMIDGT